MNQYEQKQADRKERLEKRADSLATQSRATLDLARQRASAIPFGQPILVGHHSEGRDRRYRAGIENLHRKGFQQYDAAKDLQRRADAVGTGGISSDDPDAIAKLRDQLTALEATQQLMKDVNKVLRSKQGEAERLAALEALKAARPDTWARLRLNPMAGNGFPSYSLSNNNANIRRIRERIESLEAAAKREATSHTGNGYEYRENIEDNRAEFVFPGKPGEEIRQLLKRNGFKWAPSRGAWVRMLTANARGAAQWVREKLDAAEQ